MADGEGTKDIEDPGSTLIRRQLGRRLRDAREGAGMTIQRAADLMEWGKTTLQRIEKGTAPKIRVREVVDLCEMYGLDEDQTATIKSLAEQAPVKSWWHAYSDLIPASVNLFVGLEAGAKALTIFQPFVVPGLFQTADYARALDRIYFPNESDEELDRRVALRMQRQNVIKRQRHPATATVVLHESVLRIVIGSSKVMAAQLRHIADLSTHDNIDVRVLPFRAGHPLGMPLTPFVMFEFGRDARGRLIEPTVVFSESIAGAMYFERQQAEVKLYRDSFRTIQRFTLDARSSRDLLREVAHGYESDR